jgi:soluble lytic murein transglycosylase-like protein
MQLRAWGLGFLAGAALASWVTLSCATGHAQRAPLALEGLNDGHEGNAVVEAIEEGIRLGLPRAWAWRVARCESRLNASAYNRRSGASGLYQFLPSTWRHTPQGRAGMSVFDPYANAAAAAWLFTNYGPRHWSCQ